MGKGEALTGGRTRNSIMADAFEAVVGAIYMDCSYSAARDFILIQLERYLQLVEKGIYGKDYKTYFQELYLRNKIRLNLFPILKNEYNQKQY